MRPRGVFRWVGIWLLSFAAFAVVSPLDWETGARFTAWITVGAGALGLGIPFLCRRLGSPSSKVLRWLLLTSVLLGIVSLATGLFNGQTFEAYTTPRYAAIFLAGHDPYTTRLVTQFTVCAGPSATGLIACVTHPSSTYYLYLPVLTFVQIPGTSYLGLTLLCWGIVVWILRHDPFASLTFGSPFVALLAANGYNDFPVFLLLTLAFVGWNGRRSKVAELLALGMKQFANLIVVGLYLFRRDWKNAGVALLVSVAFLLPFLIWSPGAVVCTVLLHRNPDCSPGPSGDLLDHLNYWAWPLWVLAAFSGPILSTLERLRAGEFRSAFRARGPPAEPAPGRRA